MSFTQDVEKRVLGNGLRVLVKEQRSAPVTAVVAHVRVGYFNEPDRWNGISHVIEHMLFKGTRNRPHKEQIASDVRAIGGSINAGTYYEDTTYYITVPSLHTESAIEILSDMLRSSLIDPEELAKELEVIIQESKQKRDNPRAMLYETMYAKAFDRHRIRRWRIGEDETLRGFRRDDLAEFISQTYVPENIVVSIVGDIGAEAALSLAERYWGDMDRKPLRKEESPAESARDEFRYHRMTADIQQRLLVFGFAAPPLLDPRTPALMTLDSVLSDGRSSRFYRSLKEEQRLVNSASASYEGFEALGLFTLSAEVQGDDPLPAEKGLIREISRLLGEGVEQDELRRIKTRLDSRWVFAQEEAMGLARTLSTYEVLGGYFLADEFRARLDSVSGRDVVDAAKAVLDFQASTLVEYLPESSASPSRSTAEAWAELSQSIGTTRNALIDSVSAPPAAQTPTRPAAAAASDVFVSLMPDGSTLTHRRRSDLPLIAVHVLFPGGRMGEDRDTAGITNLLLKSSLKGTESFTAQTLAETVEGLGTAIGLTLAADYLGYSMKLLTPVASQGFGILKEVITSPKFAPDEIAKEKESIYAEIRRQKDSMFARAMDLFNLARFGDHPYGLPATGLESAVAGLTPASLRDWHRKWIHSRGAIISIVGDIHPHEARELFSGFFPASESAAEVRDSALSNGAAREIDSVDRSQTASLMGFEGASIHSEDRYALDIIAELTSGLAGRFFQAVRGDNALAYAVTSFHRPRQFSGIFGTYTATSPENEELARAILLRECGRLAAEPVSDDELRHAKAAIRGEHVIHNQTFGAQAGEMAVNALYGLPPDEPERYLSRIDSVTAEEIMRAAAKHLDPERYWLGIVRGRRAE